MLSEFDHYTNYKSVKFRTKGFDVLDWWNSNDSK